MTVEANYRRKSARNFYNSHSIRIRIVLSVTLARIFSAENCPIHRFVGWSLPINLRVPGRPVWFAPFQSLPHRELRPCARVSSIEPHWSAESRLQTEILALLGRPLEHERTEDCETNDNCVGSEPRVDLTSLLARMPSTCPFLFPASKSALWI